jgi:hypothetical protein
MDTPDPIDFGPRRLQQWLNGLLAAVSARTPVAGTGLTASEHQGGIVLALDQSALPDVADGTEDPGEEGEGGEGGGGIPAGFGIVQIRACDNAGNRVTLEVIAREV